MPQKRKNYNQQQNTLEQINAQYGQLPPQAIEVEEAVLGAVMLERDAIFKVLPIIQNESFYKEEHRKIFAVVEQMAASNKVIDLLQVTQALRDNAQLDEVGGPGYITKLTRRVAGAAHIEHHAKIIFQKYVQREIIRRCSELMSQAYQDDFDELELMYTMQTQAIDDLMVGSTGMMHISHVLKKTTTDLKERQEVAQRGETPGVETGSYDLNQKNSGWQPGELIVIGARPSMGKTALAINLFGKAAAGKGKQTCIFSLEMENIALSKRLICSYGGVVRENMERGTMSPGDWAAYEKAKAELSRMPIFIDDTAAVTHRYIDAVIRNKARRGECDMAIIDYLQLVESPESYSNKNREREVAEISRGLKKTARSTGIPILLLVQLNRAIENREDKRPRMADIRESGSIEQDADVIIFPWRPTFYGITEDANGNSLENTMLLEIAKYRNSSLDTIPLKHNHDLTQFYDYNTRQFTEPAFWEETEKE